MSCAEAVIWPESIRAGLDLGSRQTKLLAAGPEGIVLERVLDSVPFLLGMRQRGGIDLGALGLDPAWPLVTTGYGRAALNGFPGISEIRAHFRGALAQSGLRDFTLVELGGQDSKVVHVEGGRVMDFNANDRCAAGTGRYLENMARLLGVDLGGLANTVGNGVEINNTCAIFGETEILAHLVEGVPIAQIMAGINLSIARRVAQMCRRYSPRLIVFCGGVAQSPALRTLIAETTGCPVLSPLLPQLNGALGCCMEEEIL